MSKSFNPAYQNEKSVSWREYQAHLKNRKKSAKPLKYLIYIAVVFFVAYAWMQNKSVSAPQSPPAEEPVLISKKSVPVLLSDADLNNFREKTLTVQFGDDSLDVTTTLNPTLQKRLLSRLDKRNSVYISIVALHPVSGKVISMISFDKDQPHRNLCLTNEFPAASIFKIITAAAAIEEKGYALNSMMHYNGFKHTLYKNQLKERTHRQTNHITFKESFAQSVNPVFGKLGSLYLKKDILVKYSARFGFNEGFNFEIPVLPSQFKIKDNSYHWAEIASGFNRQTTLSAIHAAMLISIIYNSGQMVEPTIIEKIEDSSGTPIYTSQRIIAKKVVSEKTSLLIREMMTSVVKSGTARKAFRKSRKDKILSKLTIGGKTGSISNQKHSAKFDWFVGFAEEKKGDEKIIVASLVAHGDYIGRRASDYAKTIFKHHFKDYFKVAQKKAQPSIQKDRT